MLMMYKVWCGTTDQGFATDTVNIEAEGRDDAIKQALDYLNELDKQLDCEYRVPEGAQWACYEIQDASGWYTREDPNGDFALRESYV